MSGQDKNNIPVITIDGPSGSGKGTVSRTVAKKLGWYFLDSGALYRLLALFALRRNIEVENGAGLVELADVMVVRFDDDEDQMEPVIYLNGENVTQEIRSELCGTMASQIARIPAVRQALVSRQRAMMKLPGLVADGRDMGTVIFPQAKLKIFLQASPQERAKRRYKQLKEKEIDVSLDALLKDIGERDVRDQNRQISPLRPAQDAILIDTTEMSINEVVYQVLDLWRKVGT